MTVALITTPLYALPGSAVPLTATVSSSVANFLRVWCIDAPVGSTYRQKLDQLAAGRIEIMPPDAPTAGGVLPLVPFNAQLDKGGSYSFAVQEYTLGASSYGGGYSSATAAYKTETPIGVEQLVTVYAGQRMTQRIGSTAYGSAQVLVHVWNDTIRETSIEVHGVKSPAIVNASTPRAAAAAAVATATALATLKDVPITSLQPNMTALLVDAIDALSKHYNNIGGGFHPLVDTVNDTEIEDLPKVYPTQASITRAANVLFSRLKQHMNNGPDGSLRFHQNGADFSNAPLSDGAASEADMASTLSVLADVIRSYEAHRADTIPHVVADTINTIATPIGPLLTLHRAFLTAMGALSPGGGVQTGVVQLGTLGFRLEN